ncbi:DAK2 domain-containing protein [Desmospora profundinema]
MIRAGAERLNGNVDSVNALNVFPVPDGDTGTNMNLTLTSGVKELEKKAAAGSAHVGQLAEAFSKGLLMGARGNSGVILSQLFRGFGKGVAHEESLTPRQFVDGLKRGVETAYKAVIKPVEGTVLTVAREAADKGVSRARQTDDVAVVMEAVLEEARVSLNKTPTLLPVLAQANVVDAGGQGLLLIYEGFYAALTGEEISYSVIDATRTPDLETLGRIAHEQNAQAHFDTSEIEHGYCTEFMVKLTGEKVRKNPFDEEQFRADMGRFGDSLLVVADDDLVKVHIHAEHPGETLTFAQRFGDLTGIKIENMREQHTTILEQGGRAHAAPAAVAPEASRSIKPFGIVAVAAGDGIADIFSSLAVDEVIQGGQTMNPSTEELVQAVKRIHANHVFILPNNKNIILTAEQVADLVEVPVTVLPTRTIPQGLAALLAFNEESEAEENRERMMESVHGVRSGEVTYAVRDSKYEGGTIKEGDFLGIQEGKIQTVGDNLIETSQHLLAQMLSDGADVVTILYGKDVTDSQVKALTDFLKQRHPEVECEVHDGGQPLYFFLFSVE